MPRIPLTTLLLAGAIAGFGPVAAQADPTFPATVFATPPPGASGPDSITTGAGSVWVSYAGGTTADGTEPSGNSTVVRYSPSGATQFTFSIKGSVDGLKFNPNDGTIWALQNQDANSHLSIINPADNSVTAKEYAETSPSQGYDDVVFGKTGTFLSYTNPASGGDVTLREIVPGTNPIRVTDLLTAAAPGTNAATGKRFTPSVFDPDSLKLAPNGDLVQTSGNRDTLIFVHQPGAANQSVSYLPLSAGGAPVSGLDDSLYVPSTAGTLYVTDTNANQVLALNLNSLEPGTLLASVGSLKELAIVDQTTGNLTPYVTGLDGVHGLAFMEADGVNPDSKVLVTGKTITVPSDTPRQGVGSLPMHMIASPDGQYAVTTDMGFRQSLWSIRLADGVGVSHVEFPNSDPNPASNGLYYGLAFKADGTLYAAQGNNDSIAILSLNRATGELTQKSSLKTKKADFPSGLALDDRGYLYVANNDPSTFLQPSSFAIYDTATNLEIGRYNFGGTPNFPLAVAVLRDGSKAFVTSQRDGVVYVFNTATATAPTLAATVPTGLHPISLLLNKAQTRLYVANAHSDTVSIIDTAGNAVLGNVLLRQRGEKGVVGATPTGLALSPDENTLYVTLGDLNAVGVVDVGNAAAAQLRGFVSAGWYPTGAVVSPDGTRLFVANAKGTKTRYPNPGYLLVNYNDSAAYDLNLIEGEVLNIPLPGDAASLKQASARVVADNARRAPESTLASIGRQAGGITHVIYIIKENRTYDQVLGDVKQGNGEASLAIFGENVTPNQHRIARHYALLDNFYVCAEASGDGWPWSTQGLATEYVIKNLPYNYSNRGRQYDFEGQINGYLAGGFPATDPDGKALSALFPAGTPAITDVSEAPNGHIWDNALRAGLTIRDYGCFSSFGVAQKGAQVLPDNYPTAAGLLPPGHDLAGNTDFDYRRYDNDYPDSDAPAHYGAAYKLAAYGKYNAPSRFSEFNREFQEMLAKDPTGGAVPSLMMVRFNHDHTQGFTPGKFSPRAEVADNDYAVGQLVDLISHSPIWTHTAIFILEDDAQDGPDHVDCHRSPCYVISPYVKARTVDHTFYNTDSVLHSINQILGLPPLSQYDRVAAPIGVFGETPNLSRRYTAVLPDAAVITEMNPSLARLGRRDPRRKLALDSLKMNFDLPDAAPAGPLNEILWKTAKGTGSKMPAPRHSLALGPQLPGASNRVADDDDR